MLSISLCSRSLLASHEEVLLTRHAVREGTPDEALRTLAYERAIHLGELREETRELSQLACAYPPSGWEASSLSSAQGMAAERICCFQVSSYNLTWYFMLLHVHTPLLVPKNIFGLQPRDETAMLVVVYNCGQYKIIFFSEELS